MNEREVKVLQLLHVPQQSGLRVVAMGEGRGGKGEGRGGEGRGGEGARKLYTSTCDFS